MIINLPRNLSFDLDHLPEDFEEQVTRAFAEYTECTHPDYTFQDKLCFIDVAVRLLHGDKNDSKAVMELMKDTFEYQVSEYGTFPDESDFLTTEFMEYCYRQGKEDQRLYSRYDVDRHDEEKIEKMLIRLIQAVLVYEKGGKSNEES